MGPLKTRHFTYTGNEKYFYIFAMIDLASRWIEISINFDIKASTIIKSIVNEWFLNHGIPKKILSDRGTQFISFEFADFMERHKIKHVLTSPYNPTANAIVERNNKNIGDVARIMKQKTLSDLKKAILFRCNMTVNRILGLSPFEMINKYSIFDPIRRNLKNEVEEAMLK
jgi:transposase InsO family protein